MLFNYSTHVLSLFFFSFLTVYNSQKKKKNPILTNIVWVKNLVSKLRRIIFLPKKKKNLKESFD